MSDTNSSEEKLYIKYNSPDGMASELSLSDRPITIGRSPDADIITLDDRASRMHCGIRLWDGEYYIKDLKSKNGTYLNNDRVEMAKIKPGDKIRLGNAVLIVADRKAPSTQTSMSSVQDDMNEGKGYKTILREIVDDVEAPKKPVKKQQPEGEESPKEAKGKSAKLVKPPTKDKTSTKTLFGKPAGSSTKVIKRRPTAIKIKRS